LTRRSALPRRRLGRIIKARAPAPRQIACADGEFRDREGCDHRDTAGQEARQHPAADPSGAHESSRTIGTAIGIAFGNVSALFHKCPQGAFYVPQQ
jgi:hypothetical protein